MNPSSNSDSRILRTVFPVNAFTPEQLSYLEEAVASGQCIDHLATLDPWSLDAHLANRQGASAA